MEMRSFILCFVLSFSSTIYCAFGQIDLSRVVEQAKSKLDQLKDIQGLSDASIEAIEDAKQGMTTDVMKSISIALALANTLKQDPAYKAGTIEAGIREFIISRLNSLRSIGGLSKNIQAAINKTQQTISVNDVQKTIQELANLGDKLKKDSTVPQEKKKSLEGLTRKTFDLDISKASILWKIARLKSRKGLSNKSLMAIRKARGSLKTSKNQGYFKALQTLMKTIKDDPAITEKMKMGIGQAVKEFKTLINHGNPTKTDASVTIFVSFASMIILSSF